MTARRNDKEYLHSTRKKVARKAQVNFVTYNDNIAEAKKHIRRLSTDKQNTYN